MNTAVMKLSWFAALSAWLGGPARSKIAKREAREKPRVRIAGLR